MEHLFDTKGIFRATNTKYGNDPDLVKADELLKQIIDYNSQVRDEPMEIEEIGNINLQIHCLGKIENVSMQSFILMKNSISVSVADLLQMFMPECDVEQISSFTFDAVTFNKELLSQPINLYLNTDATNLYINFD